MPSLSRRLPPIRPRGGLPLPAMIALGLLFAAGIAAADTVHFKDGMRTVCRDRAWQEGEEVHCEFDGGVLIYPLADVLRIEKSPAAPRESHAVEDDADAPAAPPLSSAAPGPPAAAPQRKPPPPAPTEDPAGAAFYDPRRSKKYWSATDQQHDTFSEAVSALAEEFGRTPRQIEEQIGDSNDLGEIRRRLRSAPGNAAAGGAPETDELSGLRFYDPRRPLKYATAPERGHRTYEEALAALAAEFQKPPAWIEAHLGESNDVGAIRQRLREARREADAGAAPGASAPPRPDTR
jgi:pyruvate/2-oxoglutarate dehydrogenase complex dihydrolipoamide acyltransferase (E2) component